MNTILLFLDIDDVLHPYAPWPIDEAVRARYFCYLPRLESVQRDFPQLQVVVTSDWRRHHLLDELRAFFSEDRRERIAGTTKLDKPAGDAVGLRQKQVEEYLEEHGLSECPWIAIDDTVTNYQADSSAAALHELLR